MKKAVIAVGGKQYLVSEGETLEVEAIKQDKKEISFETLLVIDGEKTEVGKPVLSGVSVKAEIIEPAVKADKVTAIRYKAKKRVRKVHGHRQTLSRIKIQKISTK